MSVHIVIRTVEAFTDFVPSAADDRTTEYTYDGNDKLLTLTARRADGSGQTTKYVYGALVADGHDVNSNELLTEVHHPDKTTGLPSTALAQQEFYVYNALGQPKKAHYDRNGTLHGFAFDVVGRQTDDLILLAGDGVDDAVIWLQTGYGEEKVSGTCE